MDRVRCGDHDHRHRAERCCQDLGAEDAAERVAEAIEALVRDGAARKLAA